VPGLRAKGEGSIYPFRGGYAGSVELKAGPGKQRRRKVVYGRTPTEVAERMKKARAEAAQGIAPSRKRKRVTVGMLLDEWLASIQRPSSDLSELTRHQYAVEAKRLRRFGLDPLPIGELTDDVIRDWQDAMLEAGQAPRSVMKARIPLAGVIMLARRKKLLASNPMELVPPPAAKRPNKRAISGEEAGRFLRAIRNHPFEALFLTDLLIGGRRGELVGMTWDAVDLDANTIYIGKQLQRIPGAGLKLLEPKTSAGFRLLPIPPFLTERLRQLRTEQDASGIGAGPRGLVFVSAKGKPISPDVFNKQFRALVTSAGLWPLTPHELRHSVSTILIALGVPAAVVAQYLGHADATVSLRWYTHAVPEALRDAATRMDDYVRRLADEHAGGNGYLHRLSEPPSSAILSSETLPEPNFVDHSQS
jgi:integrase